MANEITREQLEEYCKKRDLSIVDNGLFQEMKRSWIWTKDPSQAFIEHARMYETKNEKLTCRNILLTVNVQNLEAENGRLRFRYENMKKLLNQFIATGLMPGYFDIYNDLQNTKHKLKEARKKEAAANKRYKQLKKEFDRYRNEHTDSDCNPYLSKIRDPEQQIATVKLNFENYKKTHLEQFVESKCENCSFSYIDTAYDGSDVMYCRRTKDGRLLVYNTHSCPKFKPKEEKNEGSESADTE